MGKFFADIHAGPETQLGTDPCPLTDTQEITALRGASGYDELLELAKALNFQLRYREAVEVYTKAIALCPEDIRGYRQRAARYITTLQPEKAISDFLRCRELGGDAMDIAYRLGICHYLAGDYAEAMKELEVCYPLCDDEMGIAAIFWHTLSAWRCDSAPVLLEHEYRLGMQVGHHTAYEFAMRTASGNLMLTDALEQLNQEKDDLEYSIMAYGIYGLLMNAKENARAEELMKQLIQRDGFWISYAYIAAWNDYRR